MMQTPYPSRDELFAQLPVHPAGADIASYPIIHQAASDATYVACHPGDKDIVLAAYADLGWQVENVTDEDFRNMQARRATMLLLDAWAAAEASGQAHMTADIRNLFLRYDGR